MDAINYDSELRRAGAQSTHGWRRLAFLAQRHILGTIGLAIMTLFVLAALFADLICRYDPLTVDSAHRLAAPSWAHWLGTDSFGRDVWSRIIHGARISLAVGIGSTALGASIGVGLGAVVERLGVRRSLVGGMGLIAAGNLIGAAAPDASILLAARIVEGIGFFGAVLAIPSTLARVVDENRRDFVIAAWSAYMPTGIM